MKLDSLQQYVSLRRSLVEERKKLQQRLEELDRVLSDETVGPVQAVRRGRPRKKVRNSISLRQAVLKLTGEKPLTKQEILEGLKRIGYKTTSKNPMGLLNPLIYGKKSLFVKRGGKFSPKKPAKT